MAKAMYSVGMTNFMGSISVYHAVHTSGVSIRLSSDVVHKITRKWQQLS